MKKETMQPQLKTNRKNGSKTLICYYSNQLKDWDQAMAEAESRLNPSGEPMNVICFPMSRKLNDFNKIPTGANITGERVE